MVKISVVLIGLVLSSSLHGTKTRLADEHCLANADAEKILGFPARQTQSETLTQNNILQHKCTWKATQEALNSNLYYVGEEYNNAESAHKVFEDIVVSNRNNPGQARPEIGDEAWLHSDGTNFCLLIVRKGNKMIRMKVNKLTEETSIEEMKRIAAAWE